MYWMAVDTSHKTRMTIAAKIYECDKEESDSDEDICFSSDDYTSLSDVSVADIFASCYSTEVDDVVRSEDSDGSDCGGSDDATEDHDLL
jgi:hypothetical protein